MDKLKNFVSSEPVRFYEVIVAILALVAIYVPDVPSAALLAVLVPILGIGEVVRSNVTPSKNVFIDRRELDGALPLDDEPFETAEDRWTAGP